MAKELPYFKFEPAEYLTKDISFCSLAAQGLFINLCSYYWQRGCNLTKDQFLRRLNYEKELTELMQEGVIDIQGNDIKIKFLDFQLIDACKSSKTNSINGSKGGRPRKIAEENLNESEIKPKLNPIESQTKGIREDKIREDNTNITKHQTFTNQCLEQSTWCESISMREKIAPDKIQLALKDFNGHLTSIGDEKQYLKDYQYHFVMWVKKRKAVN